MPSGFYISRLSPESLNVVNPDSYREIWQVFWLGVYFKAFPLIKTVAKFEAFPKPLQRRGLGRPLYSYGDSAGLSPDFPFNPFNYYVLSCIATMTVCCVTPLCVQ